MDYKITGTLKICCTTDAGSKCEYHGDFMLNIGSLPENQNITVWSRPHTSYFSKSIAVVHSVQIDHQFKEHESFATSELELVTLSGAIQEYDSETSNVLGDFNGESFAAKDVFQVDGQKRINGDTCYAEVILKFVKT